MKKILGVTLVIIMLCLAVSCTDLGASGNKGGESEEHEHTLGEWKPESESITDCEGADFVAVCSECSETEKRKGTADDHKWKDDFDDAKHWKKCELCQKTKDEAAHVYDRECDSECNVCYGWREVTHTDSNYDGMCDREGCGAFVACQHIDGDNNALCDGCNKPISGTIPLVNRIGRTSYKFVLGKGVTGNAKRKIDNLKAELLELGVAIDYNNGDEVEYEIIFGQSTARDNKYKLDIHGNGMKGYIVKVIDNKIVVIGGSEEAFVEAIAKLREEFFGINESVIESGSLTNVYIYRDKEISYVQDDYAVNLITLGGQDIRGFKITYSGGEARTSAIKLQNLLYEKTGYWLESALASEAEDNTIFLSLVDKCGESGFSAEFSENKIVFTSEYDTTIQKLPYDFFVDALLAVPSGSGTLALSSESENYPKFKRNAHYVYYEDFGAVGDGVTNDADAIYEAHSFAVSGRHTKIIGTPGKTYLIGEIDSKSASIITCDVDWTDVKFIIDDREQTITNGYRGSVFEVRGGVSYGFSASESEFLTQLNANGGFKASEMTSFDLGIGHAAMISVSNDTHKYFIRQGVNANDGNTQRELILVDADGNIDPKARFLFNYEKVTYVTVYRVDPETVAPITINGGEFTTIAHDQTQASTYTGQRCITVYRHNTTVKNLKHYITGEPDGEKGSAYPNFMDINKAYNVLIEDCVFTAHKTYYNYKGTTRVGQGTYDITTHDSLEVIWRRCTESNFYNKSGKKSYGFWGINGGGGSKRVTYDGCTLSRFDAHTGIMHAYIVDSVVGSVDVVGGGNLHIINSKIYGTTMIRFREDYGAFWYGDVLVKNSTMVDQKGTATTGQLFNTSWVNHYYGYETAMPTTIVIDGLKVEGEPGITTQVVDINIFSSSFINNSANYNALKIGDADNVNIMTPPGSIIVRNNTAGLNFNLSAFDGKTYFANTHIEQIPVKTLPECSSHKDLDGDYTCDDCWEYIPAY